MSTERIARMRGRTQGDRKLDTTPYLTSLPSRGDVWLVDLGVPVGHEFGYRHPALILSSDALNHGNLGITIAVPMSTRYKGLPSHVLIEPPEGGLKQPSYIRCEDVRSLSTRRLSARWGRVSEETLESVAYRVKLLFDFS